MNDWKEEDDDDGKEKKCPHDEKIEQSTPAALLLGVEKSRENSPDYIVYKF